MALSRSLMRVGRKDDAIRVLEEAIELDPFDSVISDTTRTT